MSGDDADRVRKSVAAELQVHPRLIDQNLGPDQDQAAALAAALPALTAFGSESFAAVRALLDWDHRIPTRLVLLRIWATYDDETTELLDEALAERRQRIATENIYPEFDVPDFSGLEGHESYTVTLRPGAFVPGDLAFVSSWRRDVEREVRDRVLAVVTASEAYRRAWARRRDQNGLGGPVVVGWTPPAAAGSERWCVEIWLLVEFNGHSGIAVSLMVDPVLGEIIREADAEVHVA